MARNGYDSLSVECGDKDGTRCIDHSHLYSMLEASKSAYYDLSIYESFYFDTIQPNVERTHNRVAAICYINEVARICKISDQTRDISIQIFDKFIALSIRDRVNQVDDLFFSKATATALIIACKFHESERSYLLKMTSFDLFCKELVAFECQFLSKIEFSIKPSITPSLFIEYFISLCRYDYDEITIQKLYISGSNLLTEFWEDPASLLFSPGTIAFSIIFISFRLVQVNHVPWLQHVPECCTSSFIPSGSDYNGINTSFYNVEKCKQVIQTILIPIPVSPVGITDGSFSPAYVGSTIVNGDSNSNYRQNSFVNNMETQNDSLSFSFDISAIEADSNVENKKVIDANANYIFRTISHI